MENPNITAVIPAFNAQDTLLRAVTSVLAQTHKDVEVIIVDDGSTDNTLIVAQSITDDRVSVISQSNKGPGAARNAALQLARGKWIAFLDADDTWEPHFFYDAEQALSNNPAIHFYFGASQNVANADKNSTRKTGDNISIVTVDRKLTTKKLRRQTELSLCLMLADRQTLIMLGGYYDKNKCTYGEDSILCFLIFWLYPVAMTTNVVHTYHQLETGLSMSRHVNVQVQPIVSDSEYLLARIPKDTHKQVTNYISYLASVDAYRLAKVGKSASGYRLIKDHNVLACAKEPRVLWSLCRFAAFTVLNTLRK